MWGKIVKIIIDSAKAWMRFLSDILPGWILKIINFFTDFKANVSQVWNDIKTAIIAEVKEIVTGIFDVFGDLANLPKKMMEWGKNALSGFSEGIKSKLGELGDSLKSAGNKIKDFFGFESPPKEGPLANSDEWMPNMMAMFGEGITDNIPKVIIPVKKLASNMTKIFDTLKTDLSNIIKDIVGYLENNLSNAIYNLLSGAEKIELTWKSFWEGLKDILIKAVAAMIAKLIILASFSWLFNLLGIPVSLLGLNKGGKVEKNKGGEVEGFAAGGSPRDTVPAMLTPGEYVISKPMVDFIKKTGTVTGNLIDAIKTGTKTPTASFAGGGGVSNPISNTINIGAGAIVINTPKFGEADAQNMFRLIERQAKMRGLAWGKA